MPGRGRFWSVGSLNDEIVEEADLTQALQTKVNAGGGGSGAWEKVTEVELVSDGPVIDMPISPSIVMDTVAQVKIIGQIKMGNGEDDEILYKINNVFGQHDSLGTKVEQGDVTVGIIDTQSGQGFTSGLETPDNDTNGFEWIIYGGEELDGLSGHISENIAGSSNIKYANFSANWNTPLTAITNLKVLSLNVNDIRTGSKATVWKLPF